MTEHLVTIAVLLLLVGFLVSIIHWPLFGGGLLTVVSFFFLYRGIYTLVRLFLHR